MLYDLIAAHMSGVLASKLGGEHGKFIVLTQAEYKRQNLNL